MDRLTGLPDDVIGHVLSFLPTRDCVHTSTLAKHWRFLWSRVTAYYRDHHHVTLRPCLFTSENLVDLRFFDCASIPAVDVPINFSALKKLQLNNVVYDSEESLPHLLSGCPVLEELRIRRMTFPVNYKPRSWYYTHECNVSSPSLTRLVLDLDKACLKLDTPKLRYLSLRLRHPTVIMNGAVLDSLIEADVNLNEVGIEGFYGGTSDLKVIVRMLCNVKCLTLSTRRIKFYHSSDLISVIKFHNLTELKLGADWLFITSFLVDADNLRVLTICSMVDQKSQSWIQPKPTPNCWRSHIDKTACLKSHLERVNIVDFGWSNKQEFELVSYILRNAKVLKTMEILCTEPSELDSNKKLEVFNKLSLFERGSKKCQLIFV